MESPIPAVDDLVTALRDDDHVAQNALDRLGHLPTLTVRQILEQSGPLREAVVARLAHPHRTWQRRAAGAVVGLARSSPALASRLTDATRSDDGRLRWGAAWTLGQLDEPPALLWPAVREAMSLPDGDQRWAAARLACTLARHHAEVAVALGEAAGTGTTVLRRMALYCLRDLDAARARPLARAAIADADAGVRLAALAILGRAADPGDAPIVLPLLDNDPDEGVRRATAATLGRLGPPSQAARAALRRAMNAADPSLRRAARTALATPSADD